MTYSYLQIIVITFMNRQLETSLEIENLQKMTEEILLKIRTSSGK